MRYLMVTACIACLVLGGLLNGTVVSGQETETPTPDGTQTFTPTPEITDTPTDVGTAAATASATPDYAYTWDLSSGQSAEIVYTFTAGDLLIAVLLVILIVLACAAVLLLMTKR